MRVLILGSASSIAVTKWANLLSNSGHDIILFSLHGLTQDIDPKVKLIVRTIFLPFGYFRKDIIDQLIMLEKPDVLNAHYATGYGIMASISRHNNIMISAYGSDIFVFPKKTFFHKSLLSFVLRRAKVLASTSKCMALEILKYTSDSDKLQITPFGVDTDYFKPFPSKSKENKFIVGTVKKLGYIYGTDLLIKSFHGALVDLKFPDDFCLKIVGSGPNLQEYKELCFDLGIDDKVIFVGYVKNAELPKYLNEFSVYVSLSRSESFGVATLEAAACGTPVVVTNILGPAEITINDYNGILVEVDDVLSVKTALIKLYYDEKYRRKLGINGRRHVVENYSEKIVLSKFLEALKSTLD